MFSRAWQRRECSRTWHRMHILPRLVQVITFSRAWHRLYVFPRLAEVVSFHELGTGRMFSRAWHRTGCTFSHAWHRLLTFPALGTGCKFSRAWHRLYVFPRLVQVIYMYGSVNIRQYLLRLRRIIVKYFSPDAAGLCALGTGCMFTPAWHQWYVFPRLAQVVCLLTLGTGCMFSRAWHRFYVYSPLASVARFTALGTGCMFSRT